MTNEMQLFTLFQFAVKMTYTRLSHNCSLCVFTLLVSSRITIHYTVWENIC